MKKSIKRMQSSSLGLLSVRFLSNQKLLILVAAVVITAVNANAFEYTYEGQTLKYWPVTETTCEVAPCNSGQSGDVIIPAIVEDNGTKYSVTQVGDYAFSNSCLTSVTIPNSVISIGEEAFYQSDLNSIIIPKSVSSIGKKAFFKCRNLTSVTISEGVSSIGEYAFGNCVTLSSLTIPESVTTIEFAAFSGCSGLSSVLLPKGLTSIEAMVFNECSSLTSITIPDNVISIGGSAFFDCSNLVTVTLPESVTSIGGAAFCGCTSLTSLIVPNNVTSIGSTAFSGCSSLTSLIVPNNVTSIEEYTYWGCNSLTSIVIPENITTIGNNAFEGCIGLTSVVIPESVTSIGARAFQECRELKFINLPSGITKIPYGIFYNCSSLVSIDIPVGVTKIGQEAFRGCSSLSSIDIPGGVTLIDPEAFCWCTGLASIKINNPNPINLSESDEIFNGVNKSECVLYVPKESKDLYATANVWKDFKKISSCVDLVDGEPYLETTDFNNLDVTYTRNFKNTSWQPLYLPFAMDYDQWEPYADVAELYNVRGYDRDNDGEIDEVIIEFNRLKEGASIKPNIPYVIKAKEIGEVTFECKDKLVTAAPATEGVVECSSTKFTYAFHGIYEEKTDLFSTGAYFLSKGEFCQAANENVKLSPYRAYLTVTPKTGGYNDDSTSARAPQRIVLAVDDEMDTNGIDDVIDIAPQDNVYYDLTGRKVTNPTSGIYIQNGRKVYIK